MKKLLGIIFAIMFVITTIAKAEVTEVSRRMAGINPNLIGIVSDEYSDFVSVNTANILKVDGYRAYTNLSNLINGGNDMPLAGGAVGTGGTTELLLGGVMPLTKLGRIGSLLWVNKFQSAQLIQRFLITTANTTGAGSFTNNSNALLTNGGGGEDGIYDYENVNTAGAIPAQTTTETGNAYQDTSDKEINAYVGLDMFKLIDLGCKLSYLKDDVTDMTYSYKYSYTDAADATDYMNQTYSASNKDYDTTITLAPSARKKVWIIDLGATLELSRITSVDSEFIDAKVNAGAGNAAIAALTDVYAREYDSNDEEKLSGFGQGLKLDGSLQVSDAVKLKGLVSYNRSSISGKKEKKEIDQIVSNGGLAIITNKTETSRDTDVEEKESTVSGLFGIEAEVSKELLLGIGIGMEVTKTTEITDEERQVIDADTVKTYSPTSEENITEIKQTEYSIPMGMEWKATKWLNVRLGSVYTVTKRTDDTLTETKTYANNVDANAVVENVEESKTSNLGSPVTTVDNVLYYSGVGFNISKNLVVDVTNVAGGANVLDLGAWELSATLKF